MAVVTRILEHPRRPGRYIVEVDGREFAVVGAEAIGDTRTRVGVVVDPARSAALAEASALAATHDRALNVLSFRARSAKELRRRLIQKGEAAERVDRVIDRLREVGLVDDASYARQLARSKVLGGASKRRLHQELFKRGVEREVADDAVAEVMEQEEVDEIAVAEAAARKRLNALSRLDAATRRRRLYAYLARRGHDSDTIREAMQRVLADRGEDEAGVDGDR